MNVGQLYKWLGNRKVETNVLLQVQGIIKPLAQIMVGSNGSILLHALQDPPEPPKQHPPIPMLLWCPQCGERHIDVGEFATKEHHTHACQECGHVWRPAVVATVGVQFLPGFKNV